MKKLDLSQAITILANLGVIAGIVFLALELRQNNALMEAAARAAQNERIQDYIEQMYSVPGLAETLAKAGNGEPLTEAEDLQLFARKVRLLRGFEAQYRESTQGAVGGIPSEVWITNFHYGGHRNPPLYDVWDEAKPPFRPDFIQWMEENVVNER